MLDYLGLSWTILDNIGLSWAISIKYQGASRSRREQVIAIGNFFFFYIYISPARVIGELALLKKDKIANVYVNIRLSSNCLGRAELGPL